MTNDRRQDGSQGESGVVSGPGVPHGAEHPSAGPVRYVLAADSPIHMFSLAAGAATHTGSTVIPAGTVLGSAEEGSE